jgi:hypothetical protein
VPAVRLLGVIIFVPKLRALRGFSVAFILDSFGKNKKNIAFFSKQ